MNPFCMLLVVALILYLPLLLNMSESSPLVIVLMFVQGAVMALFCFVLFSR